MIPSVHLSYLPSFQLDVKYQSMSRHCSRFVFVESMSSMLPSHYLITSTHLPTHTEMSLYIITACLPRLHPSLTLCIWNSIFSCFISKYTAYIPMLEWFLAGMTVHKIKAQVTLSSTTLEYQACNLLRTVTEIEVAPVHATTFSPEGAQVIKSCAGYPFLFGSFLQPSLCQATLHNSHHHTSASVGFYIHILLLS